MTLNHPPAVFSEQIATIANGASLSGEIDVRGRTLCGISTPAAVTSTSFKILVANAAGGTFRTFYQNGADVSFGLAADKFIPLSPTDFAGVQFIKIQTASNEGAARNFIIHSRALN